jgi:Carboxypeptidase regulatory-like domain
MSFDCLISYRVKGLRCGTAHRAALVSMVVLLCSFVAHATTLWTGIVTDETSAPVANVTIILRASTGDKEYRATTGANGAFAFREIRAGSYRVSVAESGRQWTAAELVVVQEDQQFSADIQLSKQDHAIAIIKRTTPASVETGQATRLSSKEVSSLPLNERDFSKLLLLAAGTMTDTNGAANFTQQFTVNGQRGVTAVFAMDGTDTSDPEMGGATFANFNVDAIQEVQSSSGVMPAEIGEGAAGFTNVITKSGSNSIHGSAFEFARNAAFDARNYFDKGRIPPFVRNEFGATIGGPVVLPGMYNGREKTFFFGEYQGFRQVLGTTQVFAVPTEAERKGIDTTAFAGDTLFVPVSPPIAPILARYPLPNLPGGAFGARTYATSSKVVTDTNQFSVRLDHRISDKTNVFGRFSFNQVNGPTTNPDQTAIDPAFGVEFFDHQRSATLRFTHAVSPNLNYSALLGYVRSTPLFAARNAVDPALNFRDGLYEGFNTADGSITGAYGNLYQARFDMGWSRRSHGLKWGVDIRLNRDTTIFGALPNGVYDFGGGTAYAPVEILSASGTHNIKPGDLLPDALTGLLTATPHSYTVFAPASVTPRGNRFDESAVRREAYDFYVQDAWKVSPRWNVTYGLRYEINSRIRDAGNRNSIAFPVGADGRPVPFFTPGAHEIFVYNPQPVYPMDWGGWGPRVGIDFAATNRTNWHAGAAITTLLPNLWLDNYVTGGFPLVFQPLVTALPGQPVSFSNTAVPLALPPVYTTAGQLLFPNGAASQVPSNTPMDVQRFQNDLQALTAGHQPQLLQAAVMSRDFRNGYIGTYSAGVDHDFGVAKLSMSYVGTSGIHLPNIFSPNGYSGADPSYAPFTQFDSAGRAIGGYGPEFVMESGSHSSYNALQTSLGKSDVRLGLTFQASYTFSKSIDDTSTLVSGVSGAIAQAFPQNPRDLAADRGPSTFDVTQVFSLSLIQMLPLDRAEFLRGLSRKVTGGWQVLNITTLTSGLPFTVYSGIQQTGAGAGGSDRPDLIANPNFSTSGPVREDYFGRGANNASFFSIPIHVPGGTGPNQGIFGTLGRDAFRGPGFHQYDIALIKNTPLGRRGNGEWGILQLRAEFFNIFNIVNFGLPSNTVLGSGFGMISKTAGPSRQIQFSLRFAY